MVYKGGMKKKKERTDKAGSAFLRTSAAYRAAPTQLALEFSHTEASLHRLLSEASGRAIKLTLTDNSTSMLSVRAQGSHIAVRLHRMFLGAGLDVLSELARYVRARRGKTPLFWEFINANQHRIAPPSPREVKLKAAGCHYDLEDIFNRLNIEYFDGRLASSITWGARRRGRARIRTLGSYSASSHLIRISPLLDARRVPKYYVEFVVYHEMLHAALFMEAREEGEAREAGDAGGNGQNKRNRRVHPPEFKRRERLFKDYERAVRWEGHAS